MGAASASSVTSFSFYWEVRAFNLNNVTLTSDPEVCKSLIVSERQNEKNKYKKLFFIIREQLTKCLVFYITVLSIQIKTKNFQIIMLYFRIKKILLATILHI